MTPLWRRQKKVMCFYVITITNVPKKEVKKRNLYISLFMVETRKLIDLYIITVHKKNGTCT